MASSVVNSSLRASALLLLLRPRSTWAPGHAGTAQACESPPSTPPLQGRACDPAHRSVHPRWLRLYNAAVIAITDLGAILKAARRLRPTSANQTRRFDEKRPATTRQLTNYSGAGHSDANSPARLSSRRGSAANLRRVGRRPLNFCCRFE